ncbi:MAG: imidazolonepropionase [Thermoleophilia bacterium]|nr:imidazolonepropionase [Thermoleophilia bacterium]
MTQPRASTVIHGIGTLVTPARVPAPIRGSDLAAVVEVHGAAVAIDDDGVIIASGVEADVRGAISTDGDTRFHDAHGALALPGLVDCHTHPVFAGDRAAEFELRNLGAGYEEIHAAGGGIKASVARTRTALDDGTIAPQVRRHLDWMLAAGTTTAEGKSGYALTLEHELESLRVLQGVARDHPLRMTRTLLAAHTVPVEYEGRADDYIDEVAIPAAQRAVREVRASAADVFLERGSFDAAQARRYLLAAQAAGLQARMHGDQFSDQGGIELAVEIGARSVDHLEALEADAPRLRTLAQSGVAGVLLPLSSLFLGRPYAPGRELVDAGAIVAVASDFNPGSSYGEALTLSMSLACLGCRLRAGEVLTAVTVNAAWVLGLADRVGRLDVGYRGDVVLLDQPSLAHLPYHVGSPAIRSVFVGGLEVSTEVGALT